MMNFHQQTAQESLASLRSSPQGITGTDALARLQQYGPNELVEKARKTPLMMFLGQFTDFMILVLIAAAIISGVIGEPSDTIAIIVILLLNAILGFTQEYRAEKAMDALKKMSAANALVFRDGEHITLPASELVPGDIVLLEAGNVVPADLRIIEAARLKAEEAALTGESVPVEKHVEALPDERLPLGDRKNMLYKGTFVTYGRGTAVVTATGMDTELGRIAAMIQEQEEGKTPLQKRLAHFGKRISIAILIICAVVFAGGLLRGEPVVNIFLVAISLAVAAIPEALPAVVTISLALGARKMVKQNALVRKLPAVETLGSVTYICTDKTGTLTLNKMTVEETWCDGETHQRRGDGGTSPTESLEDRWGPGETAPEELNAASSPHLPVIASPRHIFMTALALSNDARFDPSGNILGDPTEAALFSLARQNGYEKTRLEAEHPRVSELPFDSERKLMTTFHEMTGSGNSDNYASFTKGAVEVLLERSMSVLMSDGIKPLDRQEVERISERIAADGLRVMAIGMRTWKTLPVDRSPDNVESELVLLGLMGMMDPPREEAKQAVAECRSAGITPVMITGDHPLTARTIAKRVGILDGDDPKAVITGKELDGLTLEEFEQRVESIRVYARVAPEQKLKIVQALQDRGHFVAMTGDGVNDAPALKKADIGIAMGVTGTDVAKEASSMILLDDNFATIVKAVKQGRKIYDNIRKFIRYLLTTNSGEIWTLFLAPFFGLPIPLQPIHILWINLVTDGLPALALSLEPGEKDVMSRPPRHPQEGLFSHGLGYHAIWVGLLMAGVVLGLQAWTIHIGDSHWQTMVFTVLCILQLGHVMAIRSEKLSLFQQGLLSNKPLLMVVAVTICLQLATVFIPALNPVFKTQPLTIGELAVVLALSTVIFCAVEIEKYFKRRT
jgi:P-type Ca2+ transporter type 2C